MHELDACKKDIDTIYLSGKKVEQTDDVEKGYKVTAIGLHKYLPDKNNIQIEGFLKIGKLRFYIQYPWKWNSNRGRNNRRVNEECPTITTKKGKKLKDKYKVDCMKLKNEIWPKKPISSVV